MSVKFDAKSYISKQAFNPVLEGLTGSCSVKKKTVEMAVRDIAETSSQVCAAAIRYLEFSKPVVLDVDVLDGAIACLQSVLEKATNKASKSSSSSTSGLSENLLSNLMSLLNKMKSLRGLEKSNDLSKDVLANPSAFKMLKQDLIDVLRQLGREDGKYSQLSDVVTVLGRILSDGGGTQAAESALSKTTYLEPDWSKPTAQLLAQSLAQMEQVQVLFDRAVKEYKSIQQHHLVKPEAIEALGCQFANYVDYTRWVYRHVNLNSGEQ